MSPTCSAQLTAPGNVGARGGAHRVFHIKVRERGEKDWAFLARGGTNRLRIHALRFATGEQAQALISANAADNPNWEWKVVS